MLVTSIFIAAGTAAAGFVALLAAIVAAPLAALGTQILPEPSSMLTADGAVAVLLGTGVALDVIRLRWGRPSPPTAGRQVPQEWGRLLPAPVVAALYGARLGVGPLTILSTWTWWSVTIAAAFMGPATSVTVGVGFGLVRQLITVAASMVSTRSGVDHAAWFGRLRSRQRPNWLAINGLGFLAVTTFALAGCSSDAQPAATQEMQQPRQSQQSEQTVSTPTPTLIPTSTPTSTSTPPGIAASESDPATTQQQIINPAQLEDFVRTAEQDLETTADVIVDDQPTVNYSASPEDLAEALTREIDGFQPIDDPMADRYLDIEAASKLQPDPTEEISLLETRRFKGGWTRAFRNDNNDVAVTSLYQFEDAAAAEFYLEDGLITIGGYGGKFFDIDGLPGVRGFVQHFTETDEQGTEELVSLGAAFQVGPRWYLVYFVGSAETVTPEMLIPAITAQRQAA